MAINAYRLPSDSAVDKLLHENLKIQKPLECWHRLQLRIVHACQGESFSERAGREWQVALDAVPSCLNGAGRAENRTF